jgi:hypothetical protein
MSKLKALLLLPVLLAASGCEALYDIQQDRTEDQCNRLVNMGDRDACMARNKTSYEQYERERKGLKLGRSEKTSGQ